ncbi:hypothetical protein V1477_007259 [Vespula maculifrons]|uniref:Uncharacterized protein n=1 Tax=Vespula maculifrons TaxID=7453 RepID=A0ABD2CI06_VESMC
MQQPPSGGTWVERTESFPVNTYFFSVSVSVRSSLDLSSWDLYTEQKGHDRSCLEMFEADGVDSGAICKRGFIHLQFAEKPEAPEAERHLGSWILE